MGETEEAAGHRRQPPVPRSLCDVRALAVPGAAPGVTWKLAESGRQLDANVVHLPPGERVDTHVEPDLDVLLLVVAGEGTVSSGGTEERVGEGTLVWLPRGSSRSLAAGSDGLHYLTVHQRRPGMWIGRRPDASP
ncbi:cupin domain-containing protein [Streptomyces sp. Ru71]|uniref:cupin domain-containing protein n=1 Tax=Streptomyces sp. Ru71 TaxID=2080746 RepID=UPI0021563FC4|nr:cupin domain-containing protein [Streptomyces sp. Ru71]